MALEVAKRSLTVKDADNTPSKRVRSTRTSAATNRGAKKAAKQTKVKTKTAPKRAKKQVSKTTKKSKILKATKQTKKVTRTNARSVAAKIPKTNRTQPKANDMHVVVPDRPENRDVSLTRRDPLGHLVLEQLLRAEDFAGVVSTEKHILAEYSTDESIFSITPQLVVQPTNALDVSRAVAVTARETERFYGLSLTPRGSGAGFSGGSLTDSAVVDTRYLQDIGDITYKKGEAYITCGAGVSWIEMERRLRKVGYYIPTCTDAKTQCTVGGAVANNAAGAASLQHGHCADWVTALDVVLRDGHCYTIEPLTYKQLRALMKKKHVYAQIATEVFSLLEKNEKEIKKHRPTAKRNTAGYALWDVVPQGMSAFKKGNGKFDLTKLIAGSQGTIGVVTSVTFRSIPLPEAQTMIAVPIFDIHELATVVQRAQQYNPVDVEVFDARTYDLALQHPEFFKRRLFGMAYYRTMLLLYTTYHVRYKRKLPELTVLVTVDAEALETTSAQEIAKTISVKRNVARIIQNPVEEDMLWLLRRSSYALSKLQDHTKRPAAFLEDMAVPVDRLAVFYTEVTRLCKEFNIQATVHGHAGTGQLHFYPLLDFTNKTTPALIKKMSDRFYAAAIKQGGTLSGEHNDGIIRTPYLHKMFSKQMIALFEQVESVFDPADIFNPGKKVHPRFEIREVIRTHN